MSLTIVSTNGGASTHIYHSFSVMSLCFSPPCVTSNDSLIGCRQSRENTAYVPAWRGPINWRRIHTQANYWAGAKEAISSLELYSERNIVQYFLYSQARCRRFVVSLRLCSDKSGDLVIELKFRDSKKLNRN